MGNVHSGVATTSAIYDLSPSYVVMFGLAGSLDDEELTIGNVVIPSAIFYAEMGKETIEQIKIGDDEAQTSVHDVTKARPRSLHIDLPLLQMVKNYAHQGMDDVPYTVQTGVFAITERVISNDEGRQRLYEVHSKSRAVEMESYGVGYAASFFKKRTRFIAVRGISDYANPEKDDSERATALNNAAHFLVGFLKTHTLPIDALQETQETLSRNLIVIHHLSLNSQESPNAISFEDEYKQVQILPVIIDQTGFVKKNSLTTPRMALDYQLSTLETIHQMQLKYPDASIAYLGLAHVPLIFHLGHNLFRQQIETFGNEHKTGTWFKLSAEGDVLNIHTEAKINNGSKPSNDVIVRMSVSYPVKFEQLEQIPENPLAYFHIYPDVQLPNLTITYSQKAVDAFVDAFQSLRERIMREFPTVERIHLFYAGAPTVAFRCGQLINANTDPYWIIYNYSRKDVPHYGWAINLQTEEVIERRA